MPRHARGDGFGKEGGGAGGGPGRWDCWGIILKREFVHLFLPSVYAPRQRVCILLSTKIQASNYRANDFFFFCCCFSPFFSLSVFFFLYIFIFYLFILVFFLFDFIVFYFRVERANLLDARAPVINSKGIQSH